MKKYSKSSKIKKDPKKNKSLRSFRSPKSKSILHSGSDLSSISNSLETRVDEVCTKNRVRNTHGNNSGNMGITRKTRSPTTGIRKSLNKNLANTSATELKDKYSPILTRSRMEQIRLQAESSVFSEAESSTTQLDAGIQNSGIKKGVCHEQETAPNISSPSVGDLHKYDTASSTKNSKTNSVLKRSSRLRSMIKDDIEIQISPNKCVVVSPNAVRSTKREPRSRSGSFNNEYEKINSHITNMICDVPGEDDINKNDILALENFEAIEMVHDFDSIMKFDDEKIPIFQSPITSMEPVNHSKNQSRVKSIRNKSNNKYQNNLSSQENSVTSHSQSKDEINEKIILHELNTMKQDQDISEEKGQKLKNLTVMLTHEVPNQHLVESSAGTRVPTIRQRKIMRHFIRMKSGQYTAEEDRIIFENWQEFCELHDWDPKDVWPFVCMMHKPGVFYLPSLENRKKFVQFLAKDLPFRSLYSVYHRFRNLHRERKRNRYTEDEDRKILAYLGNGSVLYSGNHRKYAKLAILLNRTRISIFRRYRRLCEKSATLQSKLRWTLPLIEDFIKQLLRATKLDDVKYLRNAEIPCLIWKKLASKFNVSYHVLKRFWRNQLHMQLFCEEPIYMNDIKVKLIEYAYGKGLATKPEFNWKKIEKYFDGMHSSHLWQIFHCLLEKVPYEVSSDNLWEAIEYLHDVHIPKILNEPFDRMLPRISFRNGKAKLIDKKP